jgi:hypothetical protein
MTMAGGGETMSNKARRLRAEDWGTDGWVIIDDDNVAWYREDPDHRVVSIVSGFDTEQDALEAIAEIEKGDGEIAKQVNAYR